MPLKEEICPERFYEPEATQFLVSSVSVLWFFELEACSQSIVWFCFCCHMIMLWDNLSAKQIFKHDCFIPLKILGNCLIIIPHYRKRGIYVKEVVLNTCSLCVLNIASNDCSIICWFDIVIAYCRQGSGTIYEATIVLSWRVCRRYSGEHIARLS